MMSIIKPSKQFSDEELGDIIADRAKQIERLRAENEALEKKLGTLDKEREELLIKRAYETRSLARTMRLHEQLVSERRFLLRELREARWGPLAWIVNALLGDR